MLVFLISITFQTWVWVVEEYFNKLSNVGSHLFKVKTEFEFGADFFPSTRIVYLEHSTKDFYDLY